VEDNNSNIINGIGVVQYNTKEMNLQKIKKYIKICGSLDLVIVSRKETQRRVELGEKEASCIIYDI